MAIRSTGIRPIERNGLKGFGLTIVIDHNTDTPSHVQSSPGHATAGSVNPPTLPATLHDAWRSHGFNPDRVDR